MKVSAKYAQEHFADILSAADNGEEVEIARPNKPTLKLIVSPALPASLHQPTGRRILGAGVGEVRVPSDEEWQAMDKEIEHLMCDAPLTTNGHI